LGPAAEEGLQQHNFQRVADFDSEPMFLADGFGMRPEIDGRVLSPLEEKAIFLLLNSAARDQIPPPKTPIITPSTDSQKHNSEFQDQHSSSRPETKRVPEIPSTADRALSTASRLSF